MRYYTEKPEYFKPMFGSVYICDHIVYTRCTLFKIGDKGLAIIQQRYDKGTKQTRWTEIDPWLNNFLYLNVGFKEFFDKFAGYCINGLYPTVTIRQIMWGLKMKPLKRNEWETAFDKKPI